MAVYMHCPFDGAHKGDTASVTALKMIWWREGADVHRPYLKALTCKALTCKAPALHEGYKVQGTGLDDSQEDNDDEEVQEEPDSDYSAGKGCTSPEPLDEVVKVPASANCGCVRFASGLSLITHVSLLSWGSSQACKAAAESARVAAAL
eukprot:scaffold77663_cov21-Tisochrysis_lutea.AAC.1